MKGLSKVNETNEKYITLPIVVTAIFYSKLN